jgi:quinol monooxygenase YgiN
MKQLPSVAFLLIVSLCFFSNSFALMFTGPIALNVKVSVKPERRAEFLEVITNDAKQTIAVEPGALQFALGEDVDEPNVFYFHEQYKTIGDVDFHKATPHFKEWNDFCATDPFVIPPVVHIFQCSHEAVKVPMRPAFCLNVELCVQPELREEFLAVILNNQKGSQGDEPLCLQYDFGESLDTPNHFYFHEQYTGADAGKEGFDAHKAAPHFAAWEVFAATNPFTKEPVVSFFRTKK